MKNFPIMLILLFQAACVTVAPFEFPEWVRVNDTDRDRYSKVLTATGHPSLVGIMFKDNWSIEPFRVRFTMLRTDIGPVVIQAHCEAMCELRSLSYSVTGDFESVAVAESRRALLNRARSWELIDLAWPAFAWRDNPAAQGSRKLRTERRGGMKPVDLTGTPWMLELVDELGYTIASKSSNDEQTNRANTDLCRFLVRHSRLELEDGPAC